MATILAIGATLLVVCLFLNLSPSEKKIKRRIEAIHAVSDPQFLRSMGSLLGPEHAAGLLRGQL